MSRETEKHHEPAVPSSAPRIKGSCAHDPSGKGQMASVPLPLGVVQVHSGSRAASQ